MSTTEGAVSHDERFLAQKMHLHWWESAGYLMKCACAEDTGRWPSECGLFLIRNRHPDEHCLPRLRNGAADSSLLMHLLPPRTLPLLRSGGQNVGVTSIENGHGRAAEELTAGGTELNLHHARWLVRVVSLQSAC